MAKLPIELQRALEEAQGRPRAPAKPPRETAGPSYGPVDPQPELGRWRWLFLCVLLLLGAAVAICWAVSDTHEPNTTEPNK